MERNLWIRSAVYDNSLHAAFTDPPQISGDKLTETGAIPVEVWLNGTDLLIATRTSLVLFASVPFGPQTVTVSDFGVELCP